MDSRVQEIVFYLIVLAVAIPVHEFAHARSAVSYGDDTPRRDGRLSIAPWDHFDPLGALMCVMTAIYGFGIGWGKPVLVNPRNFRNPKWDMMKVAAWGPLSNLLMAVGAGLILRFIIQAPGGVNLIGAQPLVNLLYIFVLVNLMLLFFNLIPIYPLDGSKILYAFLPDDLAYRYDRFMLQWGMTLLLGLVFFGGQLGVFTLLVHQPTAQLFRLIIG